MCRCRAALTSAALVIGVFATLALGVVPGPLLDLTSAGGAVRPLIAEVCPRAPVGASDRGPVMSWTTARGPGPGPDEMVWHGEYVVSTGDGALTSLGLDDVDPAVDASVSATLIAVEDELRSSVASADPLVAEAARHLSDAGGKRFRPLLVALGAQFGDPSSPLVVPAAVVMELTHLATLYHDDVMDEADVRRGAPSANARWTNSVAILVGDYLFARAADIAADLGTEAVRLQARTFARLVHGQIAETVGPRGSDPIAHYLHVITEKTASLIATSARFGGMFGGAAAGAGRGPRRVRRDDRGGVPALRRPARHRQRVGAVRQDARHRPARGRADPAGALRAGRRRHRRVRGAAAGDPRPRARSPTTRCTPRRWGCCGSPRR